MSVSPDIVAAIIGSLIGATYLNILWEVRKIRHDLHKTINRNLVLTERLESIRRHVKMPPFEGLERYELKES